MVTSDTGKLPYLRDPDVQLMLRVKEGDDSAFAEIVASYQDRLVGVFWHVLHDQAAAEDLAQETFLRVYRARRGYEPTAKFSTWLFRIANNLGSNSRRGKFRRKEISMSADDSGPAPARREGKVFADKSGLMPSRQFAKVELRAIVQKALEELGDRQKMAVLLHKFEGMSYEDIADSMELTPAAVKSLLSRARESLRGALSSTSVDSTDVGRSRISRLIGMEKITRLTQQQRADLVAYLDGELDEQTNRSIEETLAKSSVARHDVNMLVRTFDLLDELPRPSLGKEFTTRTIAVVTQDDAQPQWGSSLSLSSRIQSDAARRGVICVGWLVGLVLAAAGGFLLTSRWIPNEGRMLVEELPVIENLDDYAKVDNMEFLRELQARRIGSFDDGTTTNRE